MSTGWIGVDLDGTLAEYQPGNFDLTSIGKPIPEMVERVKRWLAEGRDVRIFTARAALADGVDRVRTWCCEHLGQELAVTNVKSPDMLELYDDRAVQVERNTGRLIGHSTRGLA